MKLTSILSLAFLGTAAFASPLSTVEDLTSINICPKLNNQDFTTREGTTYKVYCNADLIGDDLGTADDVNTARACLERCNHVHGCVGAVFASDTCANDHCSCFLKSAKGTATSNTNYNAFVLVE